MTAATLPKYLERSDSDFIRVDYSGSVTSERVDRETTAALNLDQRQLSQWCGMNLDLSGAIFIEPAAFQCIIAQIKALLRMRAPVMVRVPKSKRVRDFMRVWEVDRAFYDALGYSLAALAPDADRKAFFEEEQTHYTELEYPENVRKTRVVSKSDKILPSSFFAFHTDALSGMRLSSRLAYAETEYWKHKNIKNILKRKLGSNYSYFPGRIVFESYLNAIRHPGAEVLQTTSWDQSDLVDNKNKGQFTTIFWDDGLGMGQTLLRGIERGYPVVSLVDNDLHRSYLVVSSQDDEAGTATNKQYEKIDSNLDIKAIVDEKTALLAMIFPGVTSSPFDTLHAVPNEVLEADPRFGGRGMGLHVLVNAVTEVFGGSVAFRSGQYFINIRAPSPKEKKKHKVDIRVRVRRRNDLLPEFVGNMVTVRLPVI